MCESRQYLHEKTSTRGQSKLKKKLTNAKMTKKVGVILQNSYNLPLKKLTKVKMEKTPLYIYLTIILRERLDIEW